MTDFIKAVAIRSVKTFCQTMAAGITMGAALSEIDWKYIASVAAVAAIYSVLTSVATGLPEVDNFDEVAEDEDDDDE